MVIITLKSKMVSRYGKQTSERLFREGIQKRRMELVVVSFGYIVSWFTWSFGIVWIDQMASVRQLLVAREKLCVIEAFSVEN